MALKSLDFSDININNGFWHEKQKINRDTTAYSVLKRFEDTGRMGAFRFDWKEGDENKPHYFFDSDVAKWMEGIAYILEKGEDSFLSGKVEELISLIEKNQGEDGYFNVWFTIIEPDKRFTYRYAHELYCAGHLFEAAVAYYEATGRDKFLKLMCKYADYIEKVFKIEKNAGYITPGHPEIELALIKLYRCTKEKRYLELSKWFIEERGNHEENFNYGWAKKEYFQDHLPLTEQETAEGHAVRAAYLYSGMADIAYEYHDEKLFSACRKIFKNMVEKRMYLTGGIGSSHQGEAFTIDYDLPNENAYAETCAAIALVYFASRMLKLETNSVYSDATELAMYNGFLSGVSLDGKKFFYENPLEINLLNHIRNKSVTMKDRLPITQRLEVFECSCCPPNVLRFIASVANYLYTYDNENLFIHHYTENTAKIETGSGKQIGIVQKTSYPADGKIAITVKGAKGMNLGVRIPFWCDSFELTVEGHKVSPELDKGYAYIALSTDTANIVLDMELKVSLVSANPLVRANVGKAAVMRGPVVYCAEGADNENIYKILLTKDFKSEIIASDTHPLYDIIISAFKRADSNKLYEKVLNPPEPYKAKLIPYYTFANRGESDMLVWMPLI